MSQTKIADQSMNSIKNLIQSISLDRLKVLSRFDNLNLQPLTSENLQIHGHWMAMALAAGPHLRITFKIHFMPTVGAHLAQKAVGKELSDLSFQNTSDFMKEYCNMTLGLMKKVLADNGFRTAISLPFLTRGFDEVFFPEGSGVVSSRSYWKILFENDSVVCSTNIELFDSELDLTVLPESVEQQKDVGDVEFL